MVNFSNFEFSFPGKTQAAALQEILKSNEACCVICHRPFLQDENNYITVGGWGAENATLGTTFGIGRKIRYIC